jgi:hypothetical protein
MGGKILGNRLASIVFPAPGGPIKIKIGMYFTLLKYYYI